MDLRRPFPITLLLASFLGASSACVGFEEDDEMMDEIDEDAELDELEATTYTTKQARVSNGHGTAYVWINKYSTGTRRAGLVDECSGGTSWRIKNSAGTVVASGFKPNCEGGSIGPSISGAITVQVLWTGPTSHWINALSY